MALMIVCNSSLIGMAVLVKLLAVVTLSKMVAAAGQVDKDSNPNV
jgi:hypothetical protein